MTGLTTGSDAPVAKAPAPDMKVLVLTRYDRRGGASRVRFLQYLPALDAAGIRTTVQSFFDERYLSDLYAGRGPAPGYLAGRYARRMARMLSARRYDLVWIEKEALPFLPSFLERLLLAGVPYALDFDDAWFHRYDLHPNPAVRRLLGRKLDRLMAGAALVVAGNDYLAERARQAGAPVVALIPSVVDHRLYPLTDEPDPAHGPLVIGWIGSPSTAVYLRPLAGALAAACADGRAVVRLIGSGPIDLPGVPVEILPWREGEDGAELSRIHVGIMPVEDGPWERGKCGYKLIQYMAAGRACVASPVGANRVIVPDGVAGLWALTPDEWEHALHHLLKDAGERRRMGRAGRDRVESCYSLESAAPALIKALRASVCLI